MTKIENPSREHILDRIREALRAPAPPVDMTPVPLEEIFEPVADPLGRFLAECQTNLMEAVVTANTAESAERLAGLLTALPEGEIFLQDAPAIREIAKPLEGKRSLRWSTEGAPSESCQATVTLAEAFVAQSGSVLSSSSCGGRGASVVPPTHIVYGGVSQIVPDVTAALRLVNEKGLPEQSSYVGLISGSSRTADIEKILVQGAHGPRRLVVILQRG
ncbi:MAG: LUD domain-containing protein [Candidatus Korobacteraceae bacterium]|jgi:L-lactate dehydrogenase complex protein LldG